MEWNASNVLNVKIKHKPNIGTHQYLKCVSRHLDDVMTGKLERNFVNVMVSSEAISNPYISRLHKLFVNSCMQPTIFT